MNDKTERTRTREAVSQNKLAFGILALLAIMGLVGWLSSLFR